MNRCATHVLSLFEPTHRSNALQAIIGAAKKSRELSGLLSQQAAAAIEGAGRDASSPQRLLTAPPGAGGAASAGRNSAATGPLEAAGGGSEAVEAAAAVVGLLGLNSVSELVAGVQKLVERLRKLDAVLPRCGRICTF